MYQRSTTRSRRDANKPNFVHYSKWIDEAGNYTVHFKTKVLSHEEALVKLAKRRWYRDSIANLSGYCGFLQESR